MQSGKSLQEKWCSTWRNLAEFSTMIHWSSDSAWWIHRGQHRKCFFGEWCLLHYQIILVHFRNSCQNELINQLVVNYLDNRLIVSVSQTLVVSCLFSFLLFFFFFILSEEALGFGLLLVQNKQFQGVNDKNIININVCRLMIIKLLVACTSLHLRPPSRQPTF